MCGINGFIALNQNANFSDKGALESTLKLMNDTIVHRGPDAEGVFLENPIGFGFRRLSILDLRDTANQPMLSANKEVVLIFNGEIYNYLEIKETLIAKGYEFRTTSDSEVIIYSYLEYGDDCVKHFNGMWAIAIYDFRNKRLFCSRDRNGQKPFYYTQQNNMLYFASELKSLHAALNLRKANRAKVYEYLAYGYRINDGESFLEGVNELLPGTNMIVENGQVKFQKYWTLKSNMHDYGPQVNLFDEFMDIFTSAVKLRFRSDVPVGLLLSGGLDSTSIARITDNLIQQGELEQTDIQAYIASFPDFKEDETPYAKKFIKTCKHINLNQIEINTRHTLDTLEDTIYGLDHPLQQFTSIAHNNIMKACRERGITVVLNGQGSDEAFAGYDRYISGVHLLDLMMYNPVKFFSEFTKLNRLNKWSAKYLFIQMVKSLLYQPYAGYLRAKYQEKSLHCFDQGFVKENYPHYKPFYKFAPGRNNFNNYLLNTINHQGLNHILHYEDISSMNQSIEIRAPFMDYRLMEFAFSIPTKYKFDGGVTKKIIRDTVGKMLPEFISKNRVKIGFQTPFEEYITYDDTWRAYMSDLLNSKSFKEKQIWHADKIKPIFDDPLKYPEFPFWRIVHLEIWSRMYNIDNL